MFSIIIKTVSQYVPEDRCIKSKLSIYDLLAVKVSYAKNSFAMNSALNTTINKDISLNFPVSILMIT